MLNKATIIGNLGSDPQVRTFQNGNQMALLSVATTDKWRDKNSGEQKTKTEWHKVSIFGEGLVKVADQYLRKGSKVYIEGKLQTSKFEKDGQTHYSTEIIVSGIGGKLVMLDAPNGEKPASGSENGFNGGYDPDLDDPFNSQVPF